MTWMLRHEKKKRHEIIKFLEKKQMFLDIGLSNDFFGFDTKSEGNNTKNKQVGKWFKTAE